MEYIAFALMIITSAAMGVFLACLWYDSHFEVFESH